jgi:colanic acid biosynthesis glycosyl transferase WcaI
VTSPRESTALRTVFLTQWFNPEPGAIRGLPLARWLGDHGHEVRVLTGVPNYPGGRVYPGYRMRLWQREVMDGVPVLRVPLFPSHGISAIGRVTNYTSFSVSAATLGVTLIGQGDVAYVYHPPATIGLPAMVLKLLRGMPFVYHIADMWPESVVESGMLDSAAVRRIVQGLLSVWCRAVYGQARAITVLSPGFKRMLVERGVPGDKVHVIYNWTDETMFRPIPRDEKLATELGFADRFNIVYAGNLGPLQGLDTVIRAAAEVRGMPAIQVVIVGVGQQEAELRALARSVGADNVLFLGRRPYHEMPRISALADVHLVHLRDLPFFRATIPSKTQVALACARPVLMAVNGDAADIVRKAEAGLTCPPDDESSLADAMVALAETSDGELDAMGQRGRRFYLDEMSLDIGGRHMDRLLREVAGTPPAT